MNYFAILVCAVIEMALGGFWYSASGFGKQWVAARGLSEAEMQAKMKKGAGSSYAWMALCSLLTAYVLSLLISWNGAWTIPQGVLVAFWAWLGFVAATAASQSLFEDRSWRLFWISAGYYLVSMFIMGGILAVWH